MTNHENRTTSGKSNPIGAMSLGLLAVTLVAVVALAAAPASAHQEPAECNAADIGVSIARDKASAEQGEIVNFRVIARNPATGEPAACDVTNADVIFIEPAADGTPSGTAHPLATAADFFADGSTDACFIATGSPLACPADTVTFFDNNLAWEVDVNIDVNVATASGAITGDLKQAPCNDGGALLHDSDNHNAACTAQAVSVSVEQVDLLVEKTAETSFDEECEWDIVKSVTPEVWDLFLGDSGTSEYTVDVTLLGCTETNHAVTGDITVTNPAEFATAEVSGVSDIISGHGAADSVICDVDFPHQLGPGESFSCTYSAVLPDSSQRTNTATASVTETSDVAGGSGQATISFDGVEPSNSENGEVTITDTNSEFGPDQVISSSQTFVYSIQFVCGGGEGEFRGTDNLHPNTAEIVETGQSSDALVTISCYDLDVSKTAEPSLDEECEWDIVKSVTPEVWDLFVGDSGTSEYTVDVTLLGCTGSNHAVSGDITVTNNHPSADAELNSVTDDISGVGPAAVNCPSAIVPAGGQLVCTYESGLPDGAERTNTATANQQNFDYDKDGVPTAGGTTDYSGQATISFDGVEPSDTVNEQVTITDTNSEFGPDQVISSSQTFVYSIQFVCGEGEGEFTGTDNQHPNTAEIVETSQSSDALVTISCYDLDVSKTADTTFDREWNWDVTKVADQTEFVVDEGDTVTVNYDVEAFLDGEPVDSSWVVSGDITIVNNHPSVDADLNSVTDDISGLGPATVNCPSAIVPAGGQLVCTYESGLPDGAERTNTATANQQNFDYDKDGVPTAGGTTDYSGQAPITFGEPTNEIDACADVDDTNVGFLGTACVGESPKLFEYSITFGLDAPLECGDHQFDNTATVTEQDTGQMSSADESVFITVNCLGNAGCTPGFWKNHFNVWQGYTPDTLLGSVFTFPASLGSFAFDDFEDALNYKGGGKLEGATRNLMRHATAALLNAAHENVGYPMSESTIIDEVNAALDSEDRQTILTLKDTLDEQNNLGCTIDAHGNPIEPEEENELGDD